MFCVVWCCIKPLFLEHHKKVDRITFGSVRIIINKFRVSSDGEKFTTDIKIIQFLYKKQILTSRPTHKGAWQKTGHGLPLFSG